MPRCRPYALHAPGCTLSTLRAARSTLRANPAPCVSDRVVYAATQDDAASVDFDDSFIYKEIAKPMALRSIPFAHFDDPAGLEPFTTWKDCETKTAY